MDLRVGSGYDIHRFSGAPPLVLGGVRFDEAPRLVGHSDGDAALHAIIDALLGAAALGDIGAFFPPGDPRFRNADSLVLLRAAVAAVQCAGWRLVNLDLTIIAERPRIRPRADEMRRVIAAVLGVTPEQVSIKGKTNEGLDAIGRGEALAAWAVVLLMRG